MSKTLEWVRFYGSVVDVRIDYGNRVVLKAFDDKVGYISVNINDFYVRNDGKVFIRETAMLRREGQNEI